MGGEQGLQWDDPRLRVAGDTEWRAGCRLLQTWWRQEVLGLDTYGPHATSGARAERLVGSMLPLDSPAGANFWDQAVLDAVEARLIQKGWGGLVSEDRLRRNLLSSQPLAFNLFGYLAVRPEATRAWLASLGIDAVDTEVRIEWAPPRKRHLDTGSAFDAAILYTNSTGTRGLVAVEVKYSEDLDAQRIEPNQTVLDATRTNGRWRPGASDSLRQPRFAQIWLNTLLAQSCADRHEEGIEEALSVVAACGADAKGLRATALVKASLTEPETLVWCPFESILEAVGAVPGTAEWASWIRRRYLDFGPVIDHLAPGDLRRERNSVEALHGRAMHELIEAHSMAEAVAMRVLGAASVIDQLATSQEAPADQTIALAIRLEAVIEELKSIRIDAGHGLFTES